MKKTALVLSATLIATGCAVTPNSFTQSELEAQRKDRLEQVTAKQEVLSGAVTLYEAMARAIKYNLDYKVELMEEALRLRELKLSRYDMLPTLVAQVGYSARDNYSGSRSSQLLPGDRVGAQTLEESTSSERDVVDADLTLSWDVLDFGLSYVRAQQKADEVLIANERKRKVTNRIIEDVRTAYWRAASAERLMAKLRTLESDIETALANSAKSFKDRKTPPMAALTYQRELLTIQQEIQSLHSSLSSARQQLAALMNVDPGSDYTLALPDRKNSSVSLQVDVEAMLNSALVNRPELREVSYQQRITKKQGKAALLELLPSFRFYGGYNYNSNDFLFNNHWNSWGAQASWNLLDAFRYPSKKRVANAELALLDQRALALTMAVMTQVNVSATRFALAQERLDTARDFNGVQGDILAQIEAGYKARKVSKQTYIREKMNEIVSEAKYDIAHSDLQNAFANIYAAMGLDPYGVGASTADSVADLAEKLQAHWLSRGDNFVSLR